MIGIVIPALNEAARLPSLLQAIAREPVADIVVVDGGSTDATAEIAAAHGARVLLAPRGRGQQLAAGAAAVRGDTLWFLHADTTMPPDALAAIDAALADPAIIGGNFRLVFDGDTSFARRLTGFYAWLRARGIYYGDSGIFVRRAVYERIGGIRPIALMEDYDLVLRLEAAGKTVCIDAPALVTSSRRFTGRPAPSIVAGWLTIHALYHLGVKPERLVRIYERWKPATAGR